MTTSDTTAVATLEYLVTVGAFASQLETHLNYTFRHSPGENWYAETQAAKGLEAAERELAEWVKRRHYDVYATCLEPIARGIVALAKAKEDSLVDITACATNLYSPIIYKQGPRYKFIAFNAQAPGCGCVQPEGSYTFGPVGELGLRAVILEVGYGYEGPMATVDLVLPAWGTGRYAPKEGEFVLARLESTGFSSGTRHRPYVQTDEGAKDFADSDAVLKLLLGMAPLENVNAMMTSSSIDRVIGFPGAEDYLAANLPSLGDYFVALAEKLTTTHVH